jgi:hypothetical protein
MRKPAPVATSRRKSRLGRSRGAREGGFRPSHFVAELALEPSLSWLHRCPFECLTLLLLQTQRAGSIPRGSPFRRPHLVRPSGRPENAFGRKESVQGMSLCADPGDPLLRRAPRYPSAHARSYLSCCGEDETQSTRRIHPYLARIRRPGSWRLAQSEITRVITPRVRALADPSVPSEQLLSFPTWPEPRRVQCLDLEDG